MRATILTIALYLCAFNSSAESVSVKYRGAVASASFNCAWIQRSSFINRLCYDSNEHASVKTTEKAYAAFVKNERFKQTIDLLDQPERPKLKVVK